MMGSTEGAEFIKNFYDKDVKWVHLDIAGVADDSKLAKKGNPKPLILLKISNVNNKNYHSNLSLKYL